MHIEALGGPVRTQSVGPVFLSEVKDHLRLSDDSGDAEIGALIDAAGHIIEQAAGLHLLTRSVAIWLDAWPRDKEVGSQWWDGVAEGAIGMLEASVRAFALPVRPALRIDRIETFRGDGVPTLWDASNYRLQGGLEPKLVRLSSQWPQPTRSVDGICIELTSGFGDNPNTVPADLAQAVKLLAAHLYVHRGEEESRALPAQVSSLLAPYRKVRL